MYYYSFTLSWALMKQYVKRMGKGSACLRYAVYAK